MSTPSIRLASGHQMPQLGLGTWQVAEHEVGQAVTYAVLEAGYRHIDCAAVYENESEIGRSVQKILQEGAVPRSDLFITSKLPNTDHDPSRVELVCRQTLSDLQLEYLDLYLMHWGIAFAGDGGNSPQLHDSVAQLAPFSLQSTWMAMEHLVEVGLVKSIGVANYTGPMLADLLSYAKVPPVVNQIELHPYLAQGPLLRFCAAHSIVITAYSPLGNKSRLSTGDPVVLEDSVVLGIAQEIGKSPAQVVLRWEVQRGVIVIPKSVTPERIRQNINIFDFELNPEHMAQLSALDKGLRLLDPSEKWGMPYFS